MKKEGGVFYFLMACLLSLGLTMFGCAVTEKAAEHKAAAGAAVGAAGGAAVGAALGAAAGAPGTGAAIGAGVGGLAGAVVGGELQRKEEKKEREELEKKVEELEAKQAVTPEAAERRIIDGVPHVKKRVEDPPGSGNFREVWVPEQ